MTIVTSAAVGLTAGWRDDPVVEFTEAMNCFALR
jgi:hypothetical protein